MSRSQTAPVESPVHVVAAVLRDVRGRVLLARRTRGRDLAGAWEFPGGKVEAGETPRQALRRELHEELGIEIDAESATPLIAVPQAYPGKRILLDVYCIERFDGRPRGRESQALSWSPMARLPAYVMPPADRPVVAALRDPHVYLITPEPGPDEDAFIARIDAVLERGVRRVQLRAKAVEAVRLRRLVAAFAASCRRYGAEGFVNAAGERAEVLAAEHGLGLHLTGAHLARLDRSRLPAGVVLAASAHDADELARAEASGCAFAVLGTVAASPSHPGAATLGWSGFARLRESCALPIYAIGGLREQDLAEARRHGAQGIAAIRALWNP